MNKRNAVSEVSEAKKRAAQDYCKMCRLTLVSIADNGFTIRVPGLGESLVTWRSLDMGF